MATQINKEKDPKDEEICRLQNIIIQLLEPVINVINVIEVEEIRGNQIPTNKAPLKIGKKRQKSRALSEKTVSICSHRQEVILKDIPDFEHTCKKCGKGFRVKASLDDHMTCHSKRICECTFPCSPNFEHICEKCVKGFRVKANLDEHMTCHSKRFCECTFPCTPIKAPVTTPPKAHRDEVSAVAPEIKTSDPNHSQNDEECHKCDDSENQSKNGANLDSHIENDDFTFSYNCKDCGKGFSQKSNLDRHKRSHINTNGSKLSATCTTCKKSYQNAQQLTYHMNKEHVSQATYSCQQCDNKFVTKEDQEEHTTKNHVSKVTESKKVNFSEVHSCSQCENVF